MQIEEITRQKDPSRRSRFMYILEAAFDYFISILVAGAYLAKVTSYIGMSDSMTGILTAFVSLGCGMQIVAVFLTRMKRVKSMVVTASIVNQLLFATVYLVPFLPETLRVPRSVILLVALLAAQAVMNVTRSSMINWMMSHVDDRQRGVFTAKKEIVSLVGGIAFNFLMGAVIDVFEANGNQRGAFFVCALTVLGLSLLHTFTLLLTAEKEKDEKDKPYVSFRALLFDKNLVKIIVFSVLWHIAQYICAPFLGAYEVGTLGFSMTFIATLSMVASLTRVGVSMPMGRFADKHSFASAMMLCFVIRTVAFLAVAFSAPGVGKFILPVYTVLNAVSMAGISGGTINLVYDYVPREGRVAAMALQNAIAGVAGFLTTLAVSPLVDRIQANGNTFLGFPIYAQQLLAIFACIGNIIVVLYLLFVIQRMKRAELDY